MKNFIALVITLIAGSNFALASSAPDSGASGDQRRNLSTALNDMGAVSVKVGAGGDYAGLYNVKCLMAEGAFRLCTASNSADGKDVVQNAGSAAIVLGRTLSEQITGAQNAYVISAKVVACNKVGDECVIRGITLNEF